MRRRRILVEDKDRVVPDHEKARVKTMDRAVRLLAAKPRSVEELRERLLEKLWTDAAIVDAVIERLKEYGYLNDEQYARDIALSKLRQRPQGRRRLEHTMAQKRLECETIATAVAAAFDQLPESDLIDTAIEKHLRVKGLPKTHEDRKRLIDHLLRRGFSYNLIRQKLDALKKTVLES
jgi:SOS response regulatory protein OraA/RecX